MFTAGSDSAPFVVVTGDGGESLGIFLLLLQRCDLHLGILHLLAKLTETGCRHSYAMLALTSFMCTRRKRVIERCGICVDQQTRIE